MSTWRDLIDEWVVVDHSSSNISYNGEWNTIQVTQDVNNIGGRGQVYGETLHEAQGIVSFTFEFTGSFIEVIGTSINQTNIFNDADVECQVDGTTKSVDSFSGYSVAGNNCIYCATRTRLADGPHKLRMSVNIPGRQRFLFDKIHYQPSASTNVERNHLRIEEFHKYIHLDPNWHPDKTITTMEGEHLAWFTANTTGATAVIDFVGTSLAWYGVHSSAFRDKPSTATWAIDDRPPQSFTIQPPQDSKIWATYSVDVLPVVYNQLLFKTPELTSGVHKLTVIHQSDNTLAPLTLDHLIIKNEQTSQPSSSSLSASTSRPTGTPTSSSQAHTTSKNVSAGAKAGISLGVIGLIALFGSAIFIYLRRKKQRETVQSLDLEPSPFLLGSTSPASLTSASAPVPMVQDSDSHGVETRQAAGPASVQPIVVEMPPHYTVT
ncbi:hypothetical protein BJ165DRAFT_1129909 [Panaeolus papilionaceus]|nr:hypothetical protein BJ165DRAFT_1129909 [Panaeolus papilionaceus]